MVAAAPGVTLRELHPSAICQINGAPQESVLAGQLAALGLAGEPEPRRAWRGEDASLLWNGPGGWLAVAWKAAPREWLAGLRASRRDRSPYDRLPPGTCPCGMSHASEKQAMLASAA